MVKKRIKPDPKQEEEKDQDQRGVALRMIQESYVAKLDEDMGKLHNQFVAFISSAGIPMPHVLLVLQILIKETTDQAYEKYLGGV
jgi:hypothetical protein